MNQETNHHSDHDKLIRLETTVEHLAEDMMKLTENVEKHIEEDRHTFAKIFNELAASREDIKALSIQLNTAVNQIKQTADKTADLTKVQTYAVGFIGGSIAFASFAWAILKVIVPFFS